MSKTIKNVFYQNLTFEKMMAAHKRARKHKVYKNDVIKFEFNLENNITNLINEIQNKKYHIGKYYTFKVYEPKERYIQALPYKDRIVHQWYVEEFIKPYIVPKFISTSFACLTGNHHQSRTETVVVVAIAIRVIEGEHTGITTIVPITPTFEERIAYGWEIRVVSA